MRLGFEVTVLEANRKRVGGRVKTIFIDDDENAAVELGGKHLKVIKFKTRDAKMISQPKRNWFGAVKGKVSHL